LQNPFMLHIFAPDEPAGHVSFIPNVQVCEHTEWPSMSKLSVHTPVVHSVDVLLGVVHVAPNAPPPAASGVDLTSPAQAHTTSEHARRSRCMAATLHSIR
jgi:hypothetical protein